MLMTLAGFLLVLALLASQLRPTAPAPRRPVVVLRRVYETRVIETIPGGSGRGGTSVSQSVSSSGAVGGGSASGLLRTAVRAGIWAAERSGGLLDPTLVRALERTGYRASLDGVAPASLSDALAGAPDRAPARPDPSSRWREITVDDKAEVIARPPGVMFDTGGTGKGLCADAVAHRLSGYTRFVVDCGGDIAVGGVGAQLEPYEIEVEHPLAGAPAGVLRVARGGVATSGLNVRIWRDRNGGFAHHLLDPSTGAPAWTGLVGVTALGDSALEAETLSKMALLLGAEGAREVLADLGGMIVHDSGEVEPVGPIDGALYDAPDSPRSTAL